MITVADIIALPAFDHIEMISYGEGGLSRVVRNVGIMDVAPDDDAYHDYVAGEFIITNLGFARDDEHLAEASLCAILQRDLACLALRNVHNLPLTDKVRDAASRSITPFLLYEGAYYEQVAFQGLNLIERDKEQSNKGHLIDALFTEREPADIRAAMYNIARATGATLQCVAVSPTGGDDCSLYALLSALSSVLVSFRSDWGSVETAYACRYHDCVMVFVSYARPPIDGVSRSEPDLVKRIEATGNVRCGMSEELPLGEGDLAVRQAYAALAHACKVNSCTARWADLGPESFCVAAKADRLFACTSALHRRELEAYDQANDANLLATARAFAGAFGDVRAAAEMLYQHPNTVRYRLRKLKDMFNMTEATDRELAHFLALVFLDNCN